MQNPFSLLPRITVSRSGRIAATALASLMVMTVLVRPTENAVANGDTRSLSMRHLHTGETISITYKRNGQFDADALKKLNWFLRDWRKNEQVRMDPRLFDTIWLAYHAVGATQPISVVCGYRSPTTNGMLRRRTRGVAKASQHMLGKAMDFFIPGVPLSKLRVAGMRLQRGGVGFYPTSGSPFVHMDAGGVRMWPRMTRSQLAAVFPDGKTAYLPSNGGPMPGYEMAKAEILARGGTVGGVTGDGADDGGSGSDAGGGRGIGGLFAALFGPRDSGGAATSSSPSAQMIQTSRSNSRSAPVAAPQPPAPRPTSAPQPVVLAQADQAEAAQQRMAYVPLPSRRPVDIDPVQPAQVQPVAPPALLADAGGSRMIWQQGANGQPVEGGQQLAMANIPLPPVRPNAQADQIAPQQVAVLLPPAPVARPDELQPREAQPKVAQPSQLQPKPAIFADLSQGSEGFMTRSMKRQQPQRALGFADPAPVAQVARPARPIRPTLVATRFERQNFASISAPVPVARNKAQSMVKPDLGTTASLIAPPSKTVVMRFGIAAYQDLRSEKFTGAAVKPLRTASFSAMPDMFTTGSITSTN